MKFKNLMMGALGAAMLSATALQGAFAVGVGANLETLLLQCHLDTGEDIPVVIDQGDRLFGHRSFLGEY